MMKKKFFTLFILAFLLLTLIAPIITTAHAADLTDTLNIITNVSLTDRDGNPFGSSVPKDAELLLKYEFEIPNNVVNEGDTYRLTIPEQILIAVPGSFDIYDNVHSDIIGIGELQTNGTIVITFTNYVEQYSNISGEFWFELGFDEDNIGNDDPTQIIFDVGGSADPIIIEIEFEQPEPISATVVKSGDYDSDTRIITWEIIVDPGDEELSNATVTDMIPSGLDFVAGSVRVNGAPASTDDYAYAAPVLTYTFPAAISTAQSITFETYVEDTVFTSSTGSSVNIYNDALVESDDGNIASNDAEVTVPTEMVQKRGEYDADTKSITWTITFNPMGVSLQNAVVSDVIPVGLTFVESSVYADEVQLGPTDYTFDEGTRTLTYSFGETNQTHTLRFRTTVNDDAYLDNATKYFTNNVTLTSEEGEYDAGSGPVGVPSSIIRKEGIGYNRQTAELTWRIIVNSNRIPLEDCVITDEIPLGQEYVDESIQISPDVTGQGTFDYQAADAEDPEKTGTLTYTFDATINSTYTITFKTRVTDPLIYANNVSGIQFSNTALLTATGITQSSSVTQNITTRVVNKSSSAYNYLTRRITWTITVNEYAMPLSNVTIIDNIRPYMTYVEGTFRVNGAAPTSGFSYVAATPGDPDKSGTLTYVFPDSTINSDYSLTFETEVTDLSWFSTNGSKTARNSASLIHELLPGGASAEGTRSINNTVISKAAEYTPGNRYIDWTVNINTNRIPLVSGHITDDLQAGLALDTASVRLYRLNVSSNGNLTLGDEITLAAGDFTYNPDTRRFDFYIPAPIEGAYRLMFRTLVTDRTLSPFTNTARFSGTGSSQTGSSSAISVSWSGSGSAGRGETGSMLIHKVDSRDHDILLEGAEFTLIDRFGFERTAVTDSSGSALFDMLLFDLPYTVVETSPPEGYLLSSEEYVFTIDSADDIKDLEYYYENEIIRGSIQFYKYGYQNRPLAGAVFTLYDAETGEIEVATATSGSDGRVLFANIPYGTYLIRETTPPAGYFPTDVELTATVSEDGATVITTPDSIVNEPMLGSIRITKADADDLTPLADCLFGLYSAEDTGFLNPLATALTDTNGVAVFNNVPWGRYAIREMVAPPGYNISYVAVLVDIEEHGQAINAGIYTNTKIPPPPPPADPPLSPATGDEIFMYVGIFAGTAILMATLFFVDLKLRRRRRIT